jgi:hypothetical protein
MITATSIPTTDHHATGDFDDLYRLYTKASERTRSRILEATAPGALRDRLLTMHRTLSKELFEARMTALADDREKYAIVVEALHAAG